MDDLKMYCVRFLTSDVSDDLYMGEILDYYEAHYWPGIDILEVWVVASTMKEAERIASKRIYDSWKGDRFYCVGITYRKIEEGDIYYA